MTVLEKNPDRIKAFFKDPIVAYAALTLPAGNVPLSRELVSEIRTGV